jgi:putative oxidoreductase
MTTITDAPVALGRKPGASGLPGRLFDAHQAAGRALALWIEPLFNLATRIWMGKIFIDSGLTRVAHWQSQGFLFEQEYKLGLLPPELWAVITTGFEIALPVLLFVGLFTRVPALGLLGMTAFIHFVVGGLNGDYQAPYHYVWMIAFGYLVIRGGGPLSIDGLIERRRG